MNNPFQQQPGESAKAFEALQAYLDLGPARSLAAVARQLDKTPALIERWSAQHAWTERVQAHTEHLSRVEREAQEATVREKAAEWAKRAQELKEQEWEVSRALIAKARQLLGKEDLRGSARDASRMLETASKLGRLAAGLATDREELSGIDGEPLQIEFSSALNRIYGGHSNAERN